MLRIKLRYDDVESMVQRFASNVGKSGLFLPTKSLQPIGAELKFELRLSDDTPVLVGHGRVKAARPPDPVRPRAAFGMTVELMRVTPQSRALILRILEHRRAAGIPEVGLPTAEDIDAIRRAGEAHEAHAATMPMPVMSLASLPGVEPLGPIAVGTQGPHEPPGEALLTAPRRTTGPMAAAKLLAVAPLPPEAPRKKRVAVSDLIQSASGPVAVVALPGLDDDVDVASAMARAHALAGGALDAELEALRDAAAAPNEVSIEAASAELARQLGGNAVRREHSARWARPPATTTANQPVVAIGTPTSELTAPVSAATLAIVEAVPEAAPEASSLEAVPEALLDAVLAGMTEAVITPRPSSEEIHQLSETDLEDVDHTDMGLSAPPARITLDEIDDFEILAEVDADGADASAGEPAADSPSDGPDDDLDASLRYTHRAASEVDFAARLDLGEESDLYDLGPTSQYTAQQPPVEQDPLDSAGLALARFATGEEELDDFSGDDDEVMGEESDGEVGEIDDDPYGDDENDDDRRQRVVQPIFEPDPSCSVTIAGAPTPSVDIEAWGPRPPGAARKAELPALLESPVADHELENALEALDVDLDDLAMPHAATQLQRELSRNRNRASTVGSPNKTMLRAGPQPRSPAPAPAQARPRATTEDGVLIDFDDD